MFSKIRDLIGAVLLFPALLWTLKNHEKIVVEMHRSGRGSQEIIELLQAKDIGVPKRDDRSSM